MVALPNKVKISDGTETATITPLGYLNVKENTPEKCYTNDFSAAQIDTVIITPTSGKRIEIIGVYTSVGQNAANVTLAFVNSGKIFFKLYTEKKSASTGNVICAEGGVDEAVKITCPADCFVSVGYDEK